MLKSCRQCQAEFTVREEDLVFFDRISPVLNGKPYTIPPPSCCPDCRSQLRLAWRNERSLYSRRCDKSGDTIISMYRPDAVFPVYKQELWWKDDWDSADYGRPWDPSRPFFEQFADLLNDVPQFSIYHAGFSENSVYSNFTLDIRNCYLSFSVTNSEECLYSNIVDRSRDCLDCFNVDRSELLYECMDCDECYHSFFLERCTACSDCWVCMDCSSCSNCLGCVNLHKGKYCWFNEQLSAEEYRKRFTDLGKLDQQNIVKLRENLDNLAVTLPKRFAQQINTINCAGDHLVNCQNAYYCFDVHDSEDIAYVSRSFKLQDIQDAYGIAGHELVYQVLSGRGNRMCFAQCSYDNNDCFYIQSCFNSSNLFGCVALNHKEFHILNESYEQAEYERTVARIIESMRESGEWGEFFPASISPFGYNETVAQEYAPLERIEALEKGFRWSDFEAPEPKAKKILNVSEISTAAVAAGDDLLHCAIRCEGSNRLFRPTKKELEFYRKNSLPLPHKHPDERHRQRLARRAPRKLWERYCEKCGEHLLSGFSPKRSEIIYCEACYREELF